MKSSSPRPTVAFMLLLLVSLILSLTEIEAERHQTEGRRSNHVAALQMAQKKVKTYLPRLMESIRIIPLPMSLHIAKPEKKTLVVVAPDLSRNFPAVSPCRYVKYWHPKDIHGSGCENAIKSAWL